MRQQRCVSTKKAENDTDGTCHKRDSLKGEKDEEKEHLYARVTCGISGSYNEEKGLGEIYTNRKY